MSDSWWVTMPAKEIPVGEVELAIESLRELVGSLRRSRSIVSEHYVHRAMWSQAKGERDRYREALENIVANEEAYDRGDALSAHIAREALKG